MIKEIKGLANNFTWRKTKCFEYISAKCTKIKINIKKKIKIFVHISILKKEFFEIFMTVIKLNT